MSVVLDFCDARDDVLFLRSLPWKLEGEHFVSAVNDQTLGARIERSITNLWINDIVNDGIKYDRLNQEVYMNKNTFNGLGFNAFFQTPDNSAAAQLEDLSPRSGS